MNPRSTLERRGSGPAVWPHVVDVVAGWRMARRGSESPGGQGPARGGRVRRRRATGRGSRSSGTGNVGESRARAGCLPVLCLLVLCLLVLGLRLSAGTRGTGQLAVVDESLDALGSQRPAVLVCVDREVRQRIDADGVQYSAGVLGHDLDVAVEEHPVPGLRLVAVTQRVPAAVCLRILLDRQIGRASCRERV